MITLEKILILKSIPFFRYTPDDTLYQLAAAMVERSFPANTVICEEGEVGDTLFVIVEGEVKIYNEERQLAVLGERQIFGELAALCPEKRIASVMALKNCVMLSIDHQQLYDVMYLHLGLAKGLIEMLCQRVRQIAAQHQA